MERFPTLERQEKLKSQIKVVEFKSGDLVLIADLEVVEKDKRISLTEYLPQGVI
jgi:hypothetical protein